VVSQSQTFAVTQLNPVGCQVLDLVLAPLDLNLLGLVVHLDRVHLNITAVPGAGNLLGNLLCALVGLLDGVGTQAQIAALLNQILALLGLWESGRGGAGTGSPPFAMAAETGSGRCAVSRKRRPGSGNRRRPPG